MSSEHMELLNNHLMVVQNAPIQYLQSKGKTNEHNLNEVSTYFFPSMVFPQYMELVSITSFLGNNMDDTIIKFSTTQNGSDVPTEVIQHRIVHKGGIQINTHKFKTPIILDPHQPFFFYHDKGQVKDSCLILGYRHYNGNFGKRLKTPFKK